MRVAVTSVVRHAAEGDVSGFLRVIDLDRRRVLLKTPVPESAYRSSDPNPRGGVRGARGVAAHGDLLVLATSERLFVIDPSWSVVDEITHPWMSAIHEVHPEHDGIWVACTNCDLLLKLSWEGGVLDSWSWRGDRELVRALGFRSVPRFRESLDYRDPLTIHAGVHNIAHLNGVTPSAEGLIVSLGRVLRPSTVRKRRARGFMGRLARGLGARWAHSLHKGSPEPPRSEEPGSSFAVVLLSRGEPESDAGRTARLLLLHNPVSVPNHNALRTPDGKLVYNDGNLGALVVYDPARNIVERAVQVPGSPSFPRGMAQADDGTLLVGSQNPAAIHRIDVDSGAVVSSLALGGDGRESVYSITSLPDSFNDPRALALCSEALS